MTDNIDRIRATLTTFTDVDPASIVESTTFADLSLDSLDEVAVLIALEDEFAVKLLDDATELETIGEIADLLASKMETANA